MTCVIALSLAIVACCKAPVPPAVLAADVPYQLKLEETSIEGLPGLHSGVFAVYDGKLILLAGRTAGMHTFSSQGQAARKPSFPRDQYNDTVYVVDLATQRVVGKSNVSGLPRSVANQLSSMNLQFATRDNWLYIVGGYGPRENQKALGTQNRALAIDMKALIAQLTAGRVLDADFAKSSIYAGTNPSLAVTGGAMELLNGYFLLIFGHRFDGEYVVGGGLVDQAYSEQVRAFQFEFTDTVDPDGLRTLTVRDLGREPNTAIGQDPDGPYHRRDLSVEPSINDAGNVQISAYGGVFKGGRMEGYVNPVSINVAAPAAGATNPAITLTVESGTTQLMSHYECAVVSVYSESSKTMYATFFGGISQYWWDDASKSLKRDPLDFSKTPPQDGLPFINTISTLRRQGADSAQFLHQSDRFPPQPFACGDATITCLGSQTMFVFNSPAKNNHEVIMLDAVQKPTPIGFLVGGIASSGAYQPNGSCASSKVYRVILDPTAPTNTTKLVPPQ